jgi:hypothetical protein
MRNFHLPLFFTFEHPECLHSGTEGVSLFFLSVSIHSSYPPPSLSIRTPPAPPVALYHAASRRQQRQPSHTTTPPRLQQRRLPHATMPPPAPAGDPGEGAPRRSAPAPRQELARSSPAGYGGSPVRSSPVSHGASPGGARRSARPPAPPPASPSLWQGHLLVITPNCRGKLVSSGRVSGRAGGRFPVTLFFLLQRAGFPGGCQVLREGSCFGHPFGTDSSKTAPGAGGESVPNGPQKWNTYLSVIPTIDLLHKSQVTSRHTLFYSPSVLGHETPVSCPMKIILKKVVLININLTIPALLQLGHGKFDRQHINVLVSKSSPTLLPLTFHLYDWNTQH